jgi:hypothetical protein
VVDVCEGVELLCLDEGEYCTMDCESWATPGEGSAPCTAWSALAGAASMTCAPPFTLMVYDSEMCIDFDDSSTELETLAARLVRSRIHGFAMVDALELTTQDFVGWIMDAFPAEPDPCVIEAIQEMNTRFLETTQRMQVDLVAVAELLARIGTPAA